MIEKIDIKKILTKENFQKYQKIILIALGFIFLFFIAFNFFNTPPKNTAKKELILTIPAMGGLPSLDKAMADNRGLRGKVTELLSYDKASLFVNYPQVNSAVTEIMFLWIGLKPKEIQSKKYEELTEIFIRLFYRFPDDQLIKGHPLLEENPWADLFNRIKARLLMQGHGHEIYDGVAYYNSEKDIMVIEGSLSQSYIESFATFIQSQPKEKQKHYINNYLLFVESTLGFKNLSADEKEMLKDNEFIR